MGRTTRLRSLSPGQQQRITALRHAARLLDSAYQVPGTSYRFGLDPIVGLVPGLGDLISPLFTIALLWQSHDLRLPRIVQLRMLFNVVIDTVIGIVPVAGDLFDFAWKANDMNMALLERHAYEERPAAAGDWAFVVGLTLLLLAVAILPFVVLNAVVVYVMRHVG
jgi:uncharacterized protein DUF4112